MTSTDDNTVLVFLQDLLARGLVKNYDHGALWIRNIVNSQDEHNHGNIIKNRGEQISQLKFY
jgi:hypothetical protein